MGGSLGCFFDAVPENRLRFMELGGIEKMMEAVKIHYDNPTAVLQPWYGFSSICYHPLTAKRCIDVGVIEHGLRSMRDHAKAYRVREEILQAFKAVQGNDVAYRLMLAQAG